MNYFAIPGCPTKQENTIEGFKKTACLVFNVHFEEIGKKSRKSEIVKARSLFWFLYKLHNPQVSLERLGRCFGLDHATALNGIRNINNWLRNDKIIIATVQKHLDIPALLDKWDKLFAGKY